MKKEEGKFVVNDLNTYTTLPELVSDIRFESKELRWGTKLHAYLAMLKIKEDVDHIKSLILQDMQLEEKESRILLRVLDNLSHPNYQDVLFGNKNAIVKTEVELLDSVARSFRIDRLVMDNHRIILIDFKTGNKEASHMKQITNYIALLHQTGFTSVIAYLIYINMEGELEFDKI